MLFGTEDVVVLSRCASRKSLELAVIPYSGGQVPARTSLLVDMLAEDLGRIGLLVDVASDNLAGLGERVSSMRVADHPVRDEYMDSLEEHERSDEERYLAMVGTLAGIRGAILEGSRIAETITAGDSPVGDSWALGLTRVKGALLGLYSSRTERGLDEDTVECVQVLIVLCSQLLRIHSGRDVGTREASELINAFGMFGEDGFRQALSKLDVDAKDSLRPLTDDLGRAVATVIGIEILEISCYDNILLGPLNI